MSLASQRASFKWLNTLSSGWTNGHAGGLISHREYTMVDLDPILQFMLRTLSAERFHHSLHVMQLMGLAAPRYGLDTTRASLAGLIHDIAWHLTIRQMIRIVRRNEQPLLARLSPDKLDHAHLHGPAGAWLALEHFEVREEAVFMAVRDHAAHSPNQPLITRCLHVADRLLPDAKLPAKDDRRLHLFLHGDLSALETILQHDPERRSSCLLSRVRPSDPSSLLR